MFNEMINKEYAISNNSSSEGTQEKYYKDGYWYKIDQTGCESYAEFLTSKLLELSDILPDKYVKYEMGKINGKQGCRSKSFLKPGETFITIYRLYQTLYGKIFLMKLPYYL